eukprot:3937024-Rhodomonas_salina.2
MGLQHSTEWARNTVLIWAWGSQLVALEHMTTHTVDKEVMLTERSILKQVRNQMQKTPHLVLFVPGMQLILRLAYRVLWLAYCLRAVRVRRPARAGSILPFCYACATPSPVLTYCMPVLPDRKRE